jgi:MoaA/NifB/PqqE/SkfB family radical SAM enzyme/SAM-dependent methyltransferase
MSARIGRGSAFVTATLVRLGELTNRTFVLPLLIFYPTSRCNSRCVSCDWWRHDGADDMTLKEIEDVAAALPPLGTRIVAFSGGEPLLRHDVFRAAGAFRAQGIAVHLLTSGVLLERFAPTVAEYFERVTVSLDATTGALYQAVRGVPALNAVRQGVARLRKLVPRLPVTVRATLHRANFRELPKLVDLAKTMAVDGISFLAADASSMAFGRDRPPDGVMLQLDSEEVVEFQTLVEETIVRYRQDFESGFIAGSPDALRRLPKHYAGLGGGTGASSALPAVACNAPWISIVIEADGTVRPCFFHDAIGNVRRMPLASILGDNLRVFRRGLRRLDQSGLPPVRLLDSHRMAGRAMALRSIGVVSTGPGGAREPRVIRNPEQALLDTQRAFDGVAADYDRSNTGNRVLVEMRARAIAAVGTYVPAGSRVLDLGCGPGGDDEQLARQGYQVTAVDWSAAMVAEARRRVRHAGVADRVEVHHLGIHQIEVLAPTVFDAVYSNFGPLNCVTSLPDAARLVAARLRPGGVLVASVIGRVCPWEIAYYSLRRDWARLRVRFAHGLVPVPLEGRTVWMRYATPGSFERAFTGVGFRRVRLCALGLLAPPPYLHAFADRHPSLVSWLQRADDCVGACPGLRALGDHFLVVLRKT